MRTSDKIRVVIGATLALWLGGCSVQIGKTNTIHQRLQVKKSYHDRLTSGQVGIEESIRRAHDDN